MPQSRIVVTGAAGHLASAILAHLVDMNLDNPLLATSRRNLDTQAFGSKNLSFRTADFQRPRDMQLVLDEGDRVYVVSTAHMYPNLNFHSNVVSAARQAKAGLLVYSSVLKADTAPAIAAQDHRITERMIAESGLPWVILRNCWCTEHKLEFLAQTLRTGELMGCCAGAKLRTASRSDLALAAAKVLSKPVNRGQTGRVYELAGESAYTLSDLAEWITQISGVQVVYRNLSEADYSAWLQTQGLSKSLAQLNARIEASAALGWLDSPSSDLSELIGRRSTPVREVVSQLVSELEVV